MEKNKVDELYLRVILNSLCDARCYFCHEEGQNVKKNIDAALVKEAVKASQSVGVNKVKFTGGEPLLYKDLPDLISSIREIDLEIEISMTTNGIRLKKRIDDLVNAGLERINVSIHSLDRDNYKKITKVDKLESVLEALEYAKHTDIKKIKINTTLNTYNLHEVFDIAQYARNNGFGFRVHNLLPSNQEAADTLITVPDMITYLSKGSDRYETTIDNGKKVMRFFKDGASINIKLTNPGKKCIACEYAPKCNEGIYSVRLTPEGMLRPCLYRDDLELDFNKAINEDNTVKTMEKAYRRAAL